MARVTLTTRTLLLVGQLVALAGCNGSAPLTASERKILDAWLFCGDCDAAQLDSVRSLAGRKPDATVDTLGLDLLAGVTGQRRTNFEAQFDSSYRIVSAEATNVGTSPPVGQVDYIQRYLRSANVLSRTRAAIALGRIGGARARTPLDQAVDSVTAGSLAFADPVARVVRFARDTLWQP